MNTYIVPIVEDAGIYIKKIIANNEKSAEDKLYQYFFNKYEDLKGNDLNEISDELWELGIEIGRLYDIDEFV